jgi:hypothetical protein
MNNIDFGTTSYSISVRLFTCCKLLFWLNKLCIIVKTSTLRHSSFLLVLLGDLAKFREGNISFVMSVRMEKLSSQWTDFYEILYLSIFRQSFENIQLL